MKKNKFDELTDAIYRKSPLQKKKLETNASWDKACFAKNTISRGNKKKYDKIRNTKITKNKFGIILLTLLLKKFSNEKFLLINNSVKIIFDIKYPEIIKKTSTPR